MAASYSHYNQAAKLWLDGSIDTAAVKVMLLNDDATFNAAHTTILDVAGAVYVNEVAGNGWAVHGQVLTLSFATVNTDEAIVDAGDLSITASGGDIGPAFKYVIYDDTSDKVLGFCDFDGSRIANDGTPFLVEFNSLGIFHIAPPA